MDNQRMNELEIQLKNRLEENDRHVAGTIEQMRERIDGLENAVAHLMAFISVKLRLTVAEIENENGLTDF